MSSCWDCSLRTGSSNTLFGLCMVFERVGQKPKEIPSTRVDRGCSYFEPKQDMLDGKFDAERGSELRDDGIALASDNKSDQLALAREVAVEIAVNSDMTCTADQVQMVMLDRGIELGNAAGGIFRGKSWRWNGKTKNSARTSNHSRILRVWEYVPD